MQLDNGSTEGGADVASCPFCDATNPCDHHLVSVDLMFCKALGGPLSGWLSSRIEQFHKREEIDDDFSVSDALHEVLDEVLAICDGERDEDSEGGPGMSSNIRHFYCATQARVEAAVAKIGAKPTDF